MLTKTVSNQTLKLIDRYLNFRLQDKDTEDSLEAKDNASKNPRYSETAIPINVPYFNNRRRSMALGLRGAVGKGTPDEIAEEVEIHAQRSKVPLAALCSSIDINSGVPGIKKFMVDRNIGIECSGLCYHLFNSEFKKRSGREISRELESVVTDKSILSYIYLDKIYRALVFMLRPAENSSVRVFASEKNSKAIQLVDIQPGDFITVINPQSERNHIVFIHRVDYNETESGAGPNTPNLIHYTHSIAWPSDGKYRHGVRQGTIQITDAKAPIYAQAWTEQGKTGAENNTWTRMQPIEGNITEIRRLAF